MYLSITFTQTLTQMVVVCIWQRPDKTDAFAKEEWRKETGENFNFAPINARRFV